MQYVELTAANIYNGAIIFAFPARSLPKRSPLYMSNRAPVNKNKIKEEKDIVIKRRGILLYSTKLFTQYVNIRTLTTSSKALKTVVPYVVPT